jgi:hypothetical protein
MKILRPKIIAIDFDETIVDNGFPDINKAVLIRDAKKYINFLYDEGYYIIIWTCRYLKQHLQDCKNYLDKNEIHYNSINENYPLLDFKPIPKLYYDYIVDDKDHFTIDWLQEYYKIHTLFCESELFVITTEMREQFYTRTMNHIKSVQKFYIKYMLKTNKNVDFDNDKIWYHDYSKFNKPELIPYIAITWNYFCKDFGIPFEISTELKLAMNKATEHHIRENKHHPEYWCPDKYSRDLIAKDERDKFDPNSMKPVDATAMTEEYLIEMCADWCAMGQERRNTPFEWADKVINHRWIFNKQQVDFIYKALDTMWK